MIFNVMFSKTERMPHKSRQIVTKNLCGIEVVTGNLKWKNKEDHVNIRERIANNPVCRHIISLGYSISAYSLSRRKNGVFFHIVSP